MSIMTKYELSIDNLDKEKHSLYSLGEIPPGLYTIQYDFSSNDGIKHGIYRLYLNQDMHKVDSLNFIYCTEEQDEKIKREGLYFITKSFSDLNGIVKISRNVARWNGEKFIRKLEDKK